MKKIVVATAVKCRLRGQLDGTPSARSFAFAFAFAH